MSPGLLRFIQRLRANLWPDVDDHGAPRWQVDSMEMVITTSGGQQKIVTLRLIPGVEGLQMEWHQ